MNQGTVRPFLMFEGQAEAAMTLDVSLFPGGRVLELRRHGAGPHEGRILKAAFEIRGLTVLCFDSPVPHAFSFTPAISLFVECESEDEIRRLAQVLSEGGSEQMALANYGFSRLFAWVTDRFGVSWQLNLT